MERNAEKLIASAFVWDLPGGVRISSQVSYLIRDPHMPLT